MRKWRVRKGNHGWTARQSGSDTQWHFDTWREAYNFALGGNCG